MSNRDHFFALARNIVLRPGGMSPGLEHIVANHTGAFHDTSSFYIYGADHNGEIENLINLITANPSYHTWSSSSNSLIIAKKKKCLIMMLEFIVVTLGSPLRAT